jgi:predicted acylesterase/phospholipase RssA
MQHEPAVFRIGLAMAGAASAGAYTAGALDFLLEALDGWYEAKARGAVVPRHEVRIEVASGASAGALCAALLSAAAPYEFPHARLDAQRRPGAGASRNPFYRAWVEDIDIHALLGSGDLEQGVPQALLDSSPLDRILHRSLDCSGPPKARPYIGRPFVNRYTVGNLRGVPYDLGFKGLKPASDTVYAHDDALGFMVGSGTAPSYPGAAGHLRVSEHASSTAPDWLRLGEAALASGAFPLFLRPRRVERAAGDYDARRFCNPDEREAGLRHRRVKPAWPGGAAPASYGFTAVDGGLFDNEPLDLAREVIAAGGGHAAHGGSADSAVLLIAPFVGRPGQGRLAPPGPPERMLLPLLLTFMSQCRFKPADIALANDPDVYNRFLIAPVDSHSPEGAPYWIASGPLQGFFGFLHQEYRKHDYQLGRRNCQRFLQRHFRLPADNPIVARGYAGLPDAAAWLDQDGELPIVPLLGRVAEEEEPLCEWPAGVFEAAALREALGMRADVLFRHYRGQLAAQAGGAAARLLARGALDLGWRLGRGQVLDSLCRSIDAARVAQQL